VLLRRSRYSRTITLLAIASAGSIALAACSSSSSPGATSGATGSSSSPVTITVAVTANPLMTTIEQLTPGGFEASHPNIKVKFVTYDENTEREDVEKDVATGAGQYDVVMIGPNDIASWAKNNWIVNLNSYTSADPSYNVGDLLPPIRTALSSSGNLYAVPFYGESSFMMYNKAMFAAAHVTMPANPTWAQIATLAAKLNNPSAGVAGICLRGLTGWGDNLASLDTVVNTMGGQWFNTSWDAELTSPAFENATSFYVNLVKNYGEKGAGNDSFNQCLTIMQQQKAAMWYDATPGAGQDRLRARPGRPDQVLRLAVELGAGAGKRVQEQVGRVAVHELGDLQGVHRLRRVQERLGRGPARNPHLYLPEPAVPGGGQRVRATHPAGNRLGQHHPARGRPAAGAGRPVRRDP
jgi:ABC-type glycerol-3-phosphate transport system substrate-binding protein